MKTLGIRKETKNKWEKRVPVNPKAVKALVEQGYRVVLQPSDRRIYTEADYRAVGAEYSEDLSGCDLIVGVKEIPINEVLPGIPHLFFSHTIKGQDYNMPLLQKFLDTKTTLLDYERIINPDTGRRLVFFGKYAGDAGMVDTLWGIGQRLKIHNKIDTPFLKIKRSFEYNSLEEALAHIKEVGKEIVENGLPKEICPFNICLLGYGQVAGGCREVLDMLPIEVLEPDELKSITDKHDKNKIYLSVFKEEHLAKRKDGGKFVLQDYYNDGTIFESRFEEYLPYASVIMNAIYWVPGYPVFVKKSELAKLQGVDQKLIIIGDITCDIDGSIETTIKSTEPDNSTYIYNAITGEVKDGFEGDGFADCAVDNLPCEFPREASDTFSASLMPFLQAMLDNDYSKEISESSLPEEMKPAVIAHNGKLEKEYEYLNKYLVK